MTAVIARKLTLTSKAGSQTVAVRISSPIKVEASWECLWQIEWPGRTRTNIGKGVDGVQALLLALQMVGAELYASDEHRRGELKWTDGYRGYGFPVSAQLRDLLLQDDARFL